MPKTLNSDNRDMLEKENERQKQQMQVLQKEAIEIAEYSNPIDTWDGKEDMDFFKKCKEYYEAIEEKMSKEELKAEKEKLVDRFDEYFKSHNINLIDRDKDDKDLYHDKKYSSYLKSLNQYLDDYATGKNKPTSFYMYGEMIDVGSEVTNSMVKETNPDIKKPSIMENDKARALIEKYEKDSADYERRNEGSDVSYLESKAMNSKYGV